MKKIVLTAAALLVTAGMASAQVGVPASTTTTTTPAATMSKSVKAGAETMQKLGKEQHATKNMVKADKKMAKDNRTAKGAKHKLVKKAAPKAAPEGAAKTTY